MPRRASRGIGNRTSFRSHRWVFVQYGYVHAGHVDVVWVQISRLQDVVLHLYYGGLGRHGHQGAKVACGQSELQVPQPVRRPSSDKSVIGLKGVFQHVGTAVNLPVLLALRQFGANAGRSVEGADARGCSTDAFSQGTLGEEIGFNLVVVILLDEGSYLRRMSGSSESPDELF